MNGYLQNYEDLSKRCSLQMKIELISYDTHGRALSTTILCYPHGQDSQHLLQNFQQLSKHCFSRHYVLMAILSNHNHQTSSHFYFILLFVK